MQGHQGKDQQRHGASVQRSGIVLRAEPYPLLKQVLLAAKLFAYVLAEEKARAKQQHEVRARDHSPWRNKWAVHATRPSQRTPVRASGIVGPGGIRPLT